MSKAARILLNPNINKKKPIIIHNSEGKTIDSNPEKVKVLTEFFTDKYKNNQPKETAIIPFLENSKLEKPITTEEVALGISKLNSNRASGPENIPCSRIPPGNFKCNIPTYS